MTLIEILNNIDSTHRIKYTGWESDFREVDWPTMMEFSIKTVKVDSTINTAFVYFKEVDDCSFDLELIKMYWGDIFKQFDNVRFFFNDIEIIPSFGDVGHSDKITHIDFSPIKKQIHMERKRLLIEDKYSININDYGKEYNVLQFSDVLTNVVKDLCNIYNIKPEDITISVDSEGMFYLHFKRYETTEEILKRIEHDNYIQIEQIECMKRLMNTYREDAMDYLINNIVNDSKD